MFRNLLIIILSLFLTACTLDLSLTWASQDQSSIIPENMIEAGFVDQTLPSALNKTETNFGTISPQKYYFIQPGDSSKVVRKFVKLSAGGKSELALPDNVISHRYAFSTTDRVYYFMNYRTGAATSSHYLKALDKTSFTLVDWKCNGFDVDFDVDDFEAWQEGAEGFYFRVNSTNPALTAENGKIYYSDGTACTDTGIVANKLWQASNKVYVVDQTSSLRQLLAGVPQAPIMDGATNPVVSGIIAYQGDLYFRARVNMVPTYEIHKAQTSIANAVTSFGIDYPNWIGLTGSAESIDGTNFFYCKTARCIGTGEIYSVSMVGLPNQEYSGANFGPARLLPYPWGVILSKGVSGRQIQTVPAMATMLDTGMDSGYTGTAVTEKVPENYPQQVLLNGFYFSEFYNSSSGESVLQKFDINTGIQSDAFPALKNSHSLRLRGGSLYFLAHNNEKIQLYYSDGTVGGTMALTDITSDDYLLGSDFETTTRLVRRSFDVTREGADLYVFTASQESVYLAEYSNGDMKYVKIPGASYSNNNSRILKVTSDAVYFASPAHYHNGPDTLGTAQPLHQAPGVQLISYDGTGFTYWLRSNNALPAYTSYHFANTGQTWLGIGTTRILSILVTSIKAGPFYLRKTFSLTNSTQTDLIASDTPHLRASANGDNFIYNVYSVVPADAGIYIQRAGVQEKLVTTATDARDFRWIGTTAYFVAEDTNDSLLYIWELDTTQVTPVPAKISAAVTIGTTKDEAFAKRVFTVGTDSYLLFPVATADDTDILTTAYNFWKISGSTATIYSTEEVEEVLSVSSGFYYIGKPIAGPDAGKRCIFKHTSDGDGQTACHKYIASMKPSPLGVSVAIGSKLFKLNADLTFTEITSMIGSGTNDTDFVTLVDAESAANGFNNVGNIFRFASADGKLLNLGNSSATATWTGISKNDDGTSKTEYPFTGYDEVADYSTGMATPTTDRINFYSFRASHAPQLNSVLFSTRNDAGTEHFKIFGAAGVLDTNIP